MNYYGTLNFVFIVNSLFVFNECCSDGEFDISALKILKSEHITMPRNSRKKEQITTEKGNGDEIKTQEESKDDSDEIVAVKQNSKSGIGKNGKSTKDKSKKGKKVSKSDSDSSNEAVLDEKSKPKSDIKDIANQKSNKRKRAGDDDEKTSPKKEKKELLNKVDTDIDSLVVTNTKCTTDGKSSNFKIASWNVAGLRAWLKKNGLDYIKKEQADIVCLQETKCSESKLPPEVEVKGYHTYWCAGTKEGYAGVALYSKEKPLNVKYGLGKQEYDAEGRLITAEYEKFYVIAIYVPNAGAGLKNLNKRMQWDKDLRNYLKSLDEKKPVIICGDMNVSHQAIDLANPKTNTKSAGFTQEERDGMTALLEAGFIDTFRHLYPDKTGAYTYWTYFKNARSRNVGWRLDYFIVSKRFVDNICDNVIRTEVYGSDHCPIVLFANV